VTTELQPSLLDVTATSRLDDDGESPVYFGLSLETWIKVGILGSLFVAVYWLVLRWLWDKTNPIYGEANWGHAICIPIVGLYYLYINRDELLRAPVRPSWSGMVIVLAGLTMLAYGIWPGMNQFVQGCAMIVALFGVVVLLCGWQVMKVAWFPIVYLVCGIPWPALVYSWIASPLQTLAAKVAVGTLRFTGVNAYRTGTKINMGGITEPVRTLNVAEACAGLRSLMTFITVGAAVAFLSQRSLWQKIIITISAIPIAIFCNVMRVAGQGLLDHYVSRQLSESFAHQFVGLVMLVPAFFLILLVGWILDHIFIEEADIRMAAAAARKAGVASGMASPMTRAAVATAGSVGATRTVASAKPPLAVSRTTTPANSTAPSSTATPPKPQTAAPAKPQASIPAKPQAAAPAKPQAAEPAKPQAPAVPPRPGAPRPASAVPPRPGIVPPRPGIVPPKPKTPPPPGPARPKEGQQ